MATLPPGGGRRRASLITGTTRGSTLVIGHSGRTSTIPTPPSAVVGYSQGFATASGVSSFVLSGDAIQLETGDRLLQETGNWLLIEDAASVATATGIATVSGDGGARVDRSGRTEGLATVTGVMEDPGAAGDALLLEDGFSLLQEDGDFILLELGAVPPSGRLLDVTSLNALLGVNGEYLIGV